MDKTNELSQLRDIHLPTPVGWWPLAPGWYVLGLTVLLVFILSVYFLGRRYLNGRPRREALRLLDSYQKTSEKQVSSALMAGRLSELLKRVALAYFPRETVASLQGEAWISFLNETGKGLDFTAVKKELIELPYQSATEADLQCLFRVARAWIQQRRGRCLN